MNTLTASSCVAALVLAAPARAEVSTATPTLTLSAALVRALEASPRLAEAQAGVDEARGRRLAAGLYANPELSVRGGARLLDDGPRPDVAVELSQALSLSGQRGHRVAVADDELREAEARLAHIRQALATRVHLAFIEAVRAQDLVVLAAAGVELAERLRVASQRRLAAGDAAALDVQVSRAELGRAEDTLTRARVDEAIAQVALAEVLGTEPGSPVRVVPGPSLARELPSLAQVLSEAKQRRADLEALRLAVDTARSRVELARANSVPGLTLSAGVAVEGGSDVIVGGGVSMALPLFDRGQGEVAAAEAATRRRQAELRQGELELAREVTAAYVLYTRSTAAERAFDERVVGTMAETTELLQRAFDAGKIGFAEALVLRKSLLEARVNAVETRARAAQAAVVLDVALGRFGAPTDGAPTDGAGVR